MPLVEIRLQPVSYEEYLAWPETDERLEFVDGVPIVNASPVGRHQHAQMELGARLRESVPESMSVVAEWDWVLRRAPLLVRRPDVLVVDRQALRAPHADDAPVLVAEVVSPPDSVERDLVTKRREYAESGLPWYWVVALEPAQILVLRNDDGRFVEHASAKGDELLSVTEPFPVELRPADLVV